MELKPRREAKFWATACSIGGWMVMALAVASGRGADDDAQKPAVPGIGRAEAVANAEEERAHCAVKRYEIGIGPRSYWLFEPDEPKPERAPVVVFFMAGSR